MNKRATGWLAADKVFGMATNSDVEKENVLYIEFSAGVTMCLKFPSVSPQKISEGEQLKSMVPIKGLKQDKLLYFRTPLLPPGTGNFGHFQGYLPAV